MSTRTCVIGLAAIYLAAALDAASGVASWNTAHPPLALLVGIGATLLTRGGYRFLWPAAAGLVDDLIAPGALGSGMLVGVLVGWLLMRSGVRLVSPRWQAPFVTLIAVWLWVAATAMLDRLAGANSARFAAFAADATGAAVTSAIVMTLVAMVFRGRAQHTTSDLAFS